MGKIAGLIFTAVATGIVVAVVKGKKAPPPPPPPPPSDTPVPLMDMIDSTYFGFPGLLYPGSNLAPEGHDLAGLDFASQVQPLSATGIFSPAGKIVLMSVGYSNTQGYFANYGSDSGPKAAFPTPESFIGQANAHPSVNHLEVAFACGAGGGKDSYEWDQPTDPPYGFAEDNELGKLGLTEAQVQAIWLQGVIASPEAGHGLLTIPQSLITPGLTYVQALTAALGDTLRAIRVRYPNCQQVFLSSVNYTGYQPGTSTLQPDLYAYECSFAHKWVIEAQINQMAGKGIDPVAGDLSYPAAAPWTAWALDLWANDGIARSDGLFWLPGDFVGDFIHPGPLGVEKVGGRLLDFFLTSPYTSPWFKV